MADALGEGASCGAVVEGRLFEHGGALLLVGEFAAVVAGGGGGVGFASGRAVFAVEVEAAGLVAEGLFAWDGRGAAGVGVGWGGWWCGVAGEGALGWGGGRGWRCGVEDVGWGVFYQFPFVVFEGDGDGFLHDFGSQEQGVLEVGPGRGEVGVG